MPPKTWTLLALLAALAPTASIGARELPIRFFSTADGLPDNRVKRMLVDSRGLLWICTGSGISRFDGSVFENFGLAEGLPFPSINDLIETADGDFWLASNGGGLIRVRLGSSERRYEATPISAEPTSNRVNRLFRGSDGTIWAGTDGGLFRMTTDGGQVAFARVVLKFRGHPDEAAQVWSMAEDHEGALWAGTRFGLVRLAPNGRIVSYPLRRDLENDDVFSLAYAPDDDVLWIGHRTGLLAFRVPALDAAAVAPAAQPVEDDSLTRIVLSPPQALDVPTELPRTPGGGVYFDTARPNAPPAVVDLERSASGTIRFLTPGSVWEWTRDRFAAIHDPRLPPALVPQPTIAKATYGSPRARVV